MIFVVTRINANVMINRMVRLSDFLFGKLSDISILDSCLERFARAICADDDGKLHHGAGETSPGHYYSNDETDCSTCCERSAGINKDGMLLRTSLNPIVIIVMQIALTMLKWNTRLMVERRSLVRHRPPSMRRLLINMEVYANERTHMTRVTRPICLKRLANSIYPSLAIVTMKHSLHLDAYARR